MLNNLIGVIFYKDEIYTQFPHNALNHALFLLNFLIVDAHEQSAMDRFLT